MAGRINYDISALFALKKTKSLVGSEKAALVDIEIFSDSELLVRQMNGEYKLKDPSIQKFFVEIWNLKLDLKNVSFAHVFREQNAGADNLVNQVLDRENSKLDI